MFEMFTNYFSEIRPSYSETKSTNENTETKAENNTHIISIPTSEEIKKGEQEAVLYELTHLKNGESENCDRISKVFTQLSPEEIEKITDHKYSCDIENKQKK